jgi:5-methyltetrahydrofolate--homocysteine methyltransferase
MGAYDEQPETTGGFIRDWAEQGLINAVGGCCGTTPAHIAAMAAAVEGLPPRAVPVLAPALRLSGLEAAVFA